MSTVDSSVIYTPENRKILREYMRKYYGNEKAAELYKKHNGKWFESGNVAWVLGKRSLEFFCKFFLQDVFTPKPDNEAAELAPFHYEMWEYLESMYIDDSFNNFLAVLPRGSSKSTTADFALSVWAHVYRYSIYTLVAGNTEQDAVQFISQTRSTFEENPYIRYVFGDLVDSSRFTTNKLELELTNRTKIQAVSSSGSLRGKKFNVGSIGYRPTLVIADDFQSKNNILTQEARDKKYSMYMEDMKYIGSRSMQRSDGVTKQSTKVVCLGTILHSDCLISRLIQNPTYKKMVKKGVLVDDVDELFNSGLWADFKRILFNPKDPNALDNAKEFYYQNEQAMQYPVLWQSYWNCLDLALDYYENPQSFKQEVMNDASKIGEKAFHQVTKMPAEEIENNMFTKTILVCDPAVETRSHNDYTALAVASLTSNNFRWIRKGIIKRVSFDDYIAEVIRLLKMYPDIQAVWVEKNTYNGADVREIQKQIDNDAELKSRRIQIINERQNKNKEAKIRAIGGKVDSGFIIFNEDDTEAIEQLLSYEGEGFTKHDDFADAVAEADRLLDEIEITRPVQFLPRSVLF